MAYSRTTSTHQHAVAFRLWIGNVCEEIMLQRFGSSGTIGGRFGGQHLDQHMELLPTDFHGIFYIVEQLADGEPAAMTWQ